MASGNACGAQAKFKVTKRGRTRLRSLFIRRIAALRARFLIPPIPRTLLATVAHQGKAGSSGTVHQASMAASICLCIGPPAPSSERSNQKSKGLSCEQFSPRCCFACALARTRRPVLHRSTATAASLRPASASIRMGSRPRIARCRSARWSRSAASAPAHKPCIVVRINDRGPFVRGRIIDLTPAGARALGFSGLAQVTVEPLGWTPRHGDFGSF